MTHSRGSYQAALSYNPNIVIIKLGTNDAATRNWNDKTRSTLKEDYTTMVRAFQALSASPTIYMCLPCYLPEGNTHGSDANLTTGVIPIIRQVAEETGVNVIDCHTPFVGRGWLLGDLLHPNDLGYTLLSYVIGKEIKAKYPKPKTGAYWTVAPQSRLSFREEEPAVPELTDNSKSSYATFTADKNDTLTYHLTDATLATAYSLTCSSDPSNAPTSWILQCSSTGTSWRKVHEMTNADFNPYETRIFPITTPITTGARFWRLIITGGASEEIRIHEFQLFGAPKTLHKSLLKGSKGTWSAQFQTISNEGVTRLSDGQTGSYKYCTKVESGTTMWVRFDAPEEWTLTGYGLISGDYKRRNRWPTTWTLYGSNNDGASWQTIDSRTSQFFGGESSLMEYNIASPASYKSYRLLFRNLTEGDYLELSELLFYGSTTADAVEQMEANQAPTAKHWYTLDGIPTERPTKKGVYIVGGKKVSVK